MADPNPTIEAPHGAAPDAGHGDAAAHAAHAFDFPSVNYSHNYPSPAIEWVHGHPALILNAAEYGQRNLAVLSHDPKFVSATPSDAYVSWAKDAGAADPVQLAKAMTVAQDNAWLGALPRPLSFFTHQMVWSTLAMTLMALCLLVFFRRKKDQHLPANRFQHVIEALVLFVRDEIVRPNISQTGPDKWTPFFAAIFLALLSCNLLGLITPFFATATGSIGMTAAWAGVIALLILVLGMKHNGVIGFWASIVPVHLKATPGSIIGFTLMFPLELLSLVARPTILAIRLFANMFAGHIVLLVFTSLGFIVFATQPDSVAMSLGLGAFGWIMTVALYFLELLVAVLQAYIFTLLSAVFLGMYMHPEH